MPKKLEEIRKALKRDGMSEDSSWAIATSVYKKWKKKPLKERLKERKSK